MANHEQAVVLEVWDVQSSERIYTPPLHAMGFVVKERWLSEDSHLETICIGYGPIDSRRIDLWLLQADRGLESTSLDFEATLRAPSPTAVCDFFHAAIDLGFYEVIAPRYLPAGFTAVVIDSDTNALEVVYEDEEMYDEVQSIQDDDYYFLLPQGWTRERDIGERRQHRRVDNMARRMNTSVVPPTRHSSTVPLHRCGIRREQTEEALDGEGEVDDEDRRTSLLRRILSSCAVCLTLSVKLNDPITSNYRVLCSTVMSDPHCDGASKP